MGEVTIYPLFRMRVYLVFCFIFLIFIQTIHASGAKVYGTAIAYSPDGTFLITGGQIEGDVYAHLNGNYRYPALNGTSFVARFSYTNTSTTIRTESHSLDWLVSFNGSFDISCVKFPGTVSTRFFVIGTAIGDLYTSDGTKIFSGDYSQRIDSDIVILSVSISGGSVLTAKRYGGSDSDAVQDCYVDSLGNLYLTGYYSGIDGEWGQPSSSTPPSAFYRDIFIVKYSSSLSYQWFQSISGNFYDFGYAITGSLDGTRIHVACITESNLLTVDGLDEYIEIGATSDNSEFIVLSLSSSDGTPECNILGQG
eukprot:TRINITY_DN894_c0_g1::TRINITY_DN894_c0_g1_i1::g.25420::m.25420 TRINITY_DN894_c0_g1::TRINITY_DN894_c0_g1_i1::g.25420  ORF type:complete len:309 (-),score=8.62,WD40/PF00400.27/1.9,WD40/PF00400.27/4.4e+02,WD40/PF00400.27/4.2e+02,SBBP/PF06739.6/8.6e+02,SBBP/PF06739.6/4e+03,SBBP/PF06739.6/0.1,SBBP/PF06739.6/6.4e+02 TRINITY_DN894_c0_g1_i1:2332-3258(-)